MLKSVLTLILTIALLAAGLAGENVPLPQILPAAEPDAVQNMVDFYNEKHKYYKIDNNDLKNRILNTFVQIDMFIFEAINLDTVISSGYYNLVEKPSRRKDRVMSLCYNLDIVKQKEDEYIALQNQETNSFLDYVAFV